MTLVTAYTDSSISLRCSRNHASPEQIGFHGMVPFTERTTICARTVPLTGYHSIAGPLLKFANCVRGHEGATTGVPLVSTMTQMANYAGHLYDVSYLRFPASPLVAWFSFRLAAIGVPLSWKAITRGASF